MPNGHMLRTLGHFGYILITLAHCKCIQHEPNFFHFDQHVIFGCILGTFEEESWKHLKCYFVNTYWMNNKVTFQMFPECIWW